MRHAIRYEGGFERNFSALQPGAREYVGDDGTRQPIPAWPADAAGLRFGFMEQHGKRFVAVRVQYGDDEIVLRNPVPIDRDRHLGGKRFSPEPLALGDRPASALFGDVLDANPEQQEELTAMRERVRDVLKAGKA